MWSAERVRIERMGAAVRATATNSRVHKPLASRAPEGRLGNHGDPPNHEADQSPGTSVPVGTGSKERPVEQQQGKAVHEAGPDEQAETARNRQRRNPSVPTIPLGDRVERFLVDDHVFGPIVARFGWHVAALTIDMSDSRRPCAQSGKLAFELSCGNERKEVAAVRLHGLVKPTIVQR